MSNTGLNTAQLKSWIYLLIRLGLGALFIYASLDKIWNPGLFAKSIANYKILPLPLLHISAIVLPWLEFICGLALVLNRYTRAANLLIGVLSSIFLLAIISAITRGLNINCGCFGVTSEEVNIGFWKVVQNIGIIFGAGLLESQFQKESKTSRPN